MDEIDTILDEAISESETQENNVPETQQTSETPESTTDDHTFDYEGNLFDGIDEKDIITVEFDNWRQ